MLFWWRENNLSFEQECEFLRSLGFGVELWPSMMGHSECRYERRNWSRLAAATKDMLIVMRSRNDNPTIEQWQEQIDCARMLDASIVVDLKSLGMGTGPEQNGTGFASKVIKLADKNKVKMVLETGHLALVKKVGRKFGSLSFCLDTGFANVDPQFGFRKYVDELCERVTHIHLTDNYGQSDDHEPPGLRDGITKDNWQYLLEVLCKYDNDVTGILEMSPSMPAVMIRQACEFLFDRMGWPNRPALKPAYKDVTYNPV